MIDDAYRARRVAEQAANDRQSALNAHWRASWWNGR
jgi:hypothetical protein